MWPYRLSLSVHDGLQLFKVSEFNLQFLHLGLHQQSHQRLDLPLLHRSQVLKEQRVQCLICRKAVCFLTMMPPFHAPQLSRQQQQAPKQQQWTGFPLLHLSPPLPSSLPHSLHPSDPLRIPPSVLSPSRHRLQGSKRVQVSNFTSVSIYSLTITVNEGNTYYSGSFVHVIYN